MKCIQRCIDRTRGGLDFQVGLFVQVGHIHFISLITRSTCMISDGIDPTCKNMRSLCFGLNIMLFTCHYVSQVLLRQSTHLLNLVFEIIRFDQHCSSLKQCSFSTS